MLRFFLYLLLFHSQQYTHATTRLCTSKHFQLTSWLLTGIPSTISWSRTRRGHGHAAFDVKLGRRPCMAPVIYLRLLTPPETTTPATSSLLPRINKLNSVCCRLTPVPLRFLHEGTSPRSLRQHRDTFRPFPFPQTPFTE